MNTDTNLAALPWSIGGTLTIEGERYIAVLDAGPQCPCIVALVPYSTSDGGLTDQQYAHANLITAAPELLAALNLYFTDFPRFHKAASDALAKAEGNT